DRAGAAASGQAAVPDRQGRPVARARRPAGCARGATRRARARDQRRQGHAHLPARRQDRLLRRADGGDESPARRRLLQSGAGRIGEGGGAMIALTVEDRADLIRWLLSGAIILCAHGAIAASLLLGAPPPDESSQGAAIVIELAETPVAPSDVTPTVPE